MRPGGRRRDAQSLRVVRRKDGLETNVLGHRLGNGRRQPTWNVVELPGHVMARSLLPNLATLRSPFSLLRPLRRFWVQGRVVDIRATSIQ